MPRLAAGLAALAVLVVTAVASPLAHASEEEIHDWKAVTLVAAAGAFGDVTVAAKADAASHVATLAVTVKGQTIAVPATWLATLPPLTLTGLEVRSERGYGPTPILYVVLRVDPAKAGGARRKDVHVWFQDGKLTGASITTTDAKGDTTFEQRKAP
jgi:hypothetical protein